MKLKLNGVATFILLIAALPSVSNAIQPDAEYRVREKEFGKQWEAEDKQVQTKLAALEKKFGKKPNIIFILGDDIGYTELGSYGGGKVRGFSTANLDRMADEGMRFTSFYSEPSCTPTRAALIGDAFEYFLKNALHPHARGVDYFGHVPRQAKSAVSGYDRDGAGRRRGDRCRTSLGGRLSYGHVWQVAPGRRPRDDPN